MPNTCRCTSRSPVESTPVRRSCTLHWESRTRCVRTRRPREATLSHATMYRGCVLLVRPCRARTWLQLAHGAGAGMRHPFMQQLADALAAEEIATLRWEF